MLLTDDVIASILSKNQLDLEAISDGYKSSQSIFWLSEQVKFLDRMISSIADYMNKSERPIGPLHGLRTQMKVAQSLQISVEHKLRAQRTKNARRASKTAIRRKADKDIADAVRNVLHGKPVVEPVRKTVEMNVLQAQLHGYDPNAPIEERERQLAFIKANDGNIDAETSKRQADELDDIFGTRPEDK